VDLSAISSGFGDLALDSQMTFRRALSAISSPGDVIDLPVIPEMPEGVNPAAAALLLALLDQDTVLWISPGLSGSGADAYFRFHTGCRMTNAPEEAGFLLVAGPQDCPPLKVLNCGSDEYPEQAATLVVQVQALSSADGWLLRGPGINGSRRLSVAGLADRFAAEWGEMRRDFPRGVDIFFVNGSRLVALPRSTTVEGPSCM
jgi:alpha-D-ribose 1-methylphosphonate 5-triphosphate synthase subunit PhnH